MKILHVSVFTGIAFFSILLNSTFYSLAFSAEPPNKETTQKETIQFNQAKRLDEMVRSFEGKFDLKKIEPSEAIAKLKDVKYVFVDARTPQEREVSIIPGALSKDEFKKNQVKYKQKKILFYCTIGYRSSKEAEGWKGKGFDVYNIRGGILGWTHESGPLVDGNGKPTKKVHVYGSNWDLVAAPYESIY